MIRWAPTVQADRITSGLKFGRDRRAYLRSLFEARKRFSLSVLNCNNNQQSRSRFDIAIGDLNFVERVKSELGSERSASHLRCYRSTLQFEAFDK